MPVRNYFPEKISITGRKSFSEYFLEVIGQFENEIALIDPEMMKLINYSELINQTKQMSNALIRLGVQHGDIIGTYAGNSADYIIFVLAALSLGAILVPLNPAYKCYEIEAYFKKVFVNWILTEEKLVEKIQHVNQKIIHAKIIVLDSAKETLLYFAVQAYLNNDNSSWDDKNMRYLQNELVCEHDTAMIFFSSGTTGPPKGILLSHQTLLANVELIRLLRKASTISCNQYEMVHLDVIDVVYGVLPYFHAGGLLTVFSLLSLGTRIIINRKFNNEQFLRVLRNYQIMKSSSNDEECEEMEIGEIWLKTATMMKGYVENVIDNINDTFIDGWYRTGDLGYYDFDHFIYITGRIKEMIKVRGWQVSPYEIEETIQELKDVEVCAVVGIPDDCSGQLPKAYIKLRDGAQTDENTIHQLINSIV
uniref:AMP-dependent synthetase/ligase domain-containing protein n=1 Tax=Setaria digitata TaxID=48799 RepID=A0A915Q2V5_9BILA